MMGLRGAANSLALAALLCAAALIPTSIASGAEPSKGFELRRIDKGRPEKTGRPIPGEAVSVFVYEGTPKSMNVTDRHIALAYRRSGVIFDRKSGELLARHTVLDGWPGVRPAPFPPLPSSKKWGKLVGPGVWDSRVNWMDSLKRERGEKIPDTHRAVVSASFDGRTWTAYQPTAFLSGLKLWRGGRRKHDWSEVLGKLEPASYVESAEEGKEAVRYTKADGMAGNIVTHLAPHGGKLYAASVDIYDADRKRWKTGGLSAYDPKLGRWRKIRGIAGRPVRFVTLLRTVGEDLWVGYREGAGATGSKIVLGMGLYPGNYRPEAKRIVLARLRDGEWKTWWRFPAADPGTERMPAEKRPPPSEKPVDIAAGGKRVILWSLTRSFHRMPGNWDVPMDGHLCVLDTESGKWKHFDRTRDFAADRLVAFHAQKGEALVASNHGTHRWSAETAKWDFLDTGCALRNPTAYYVLPVGDEIWVGYNMKSFSVYGRQGISRYSEKTGRWSHFTPKEIGTGSPVLQMALGPKDDVWVLFRKRFWGGAAAEFAYYPRERATPRDWGLGRFSKGKWEFPANLPGVPREIERVSETDQRVSKWKQQAPVSGLAVVGKRVFVSNSTGVYAGPRRWTRICSGPVFSIAPSENGKALLVSPSGGRTPTVATAAGKRCGTRIIFRKPTSFGAYARFKTARFYGRFVERKDWPRAWVPFPTRDETRWGLGPFEASPYSRGELTTARALWISSYGQLIRFDRARIARLLAK
jgi:hypothetical protein